METNAAELTILIADDEEDIRDGAERILKRIGFRVIKASRGDEAERMSEALRPDLVLLDLKMPGGDGMEVLKFIRGMDSRILVIVITGFATVETAIEAMKRGAYDFIPKPFEPDQLRIVVNRAAASGARPSCSSRRSCGPFRISAPRRAGSTPSSPRFPTGCWSPTPPAWWCS
ncbi:MAG: response regulator [Desulfobacterales bacterium]|nr:response regulator [Desulfobacterales bacterium]